MHFVSLFAGIGGLDLGLERAGHECALQVELDPFCRRVLETRWPDVRRIADVHEVTAEDCASADMLVAGFPCQPFSSAGKRIGVDDERWLWPEVARLVVAMGPRLLLLENVPGLLHGRGMDAVLGDLAGLGFDAEWESFEAAAVGAPHLRDRVFIVAYRPPSPLPDTFGDLLRQQWERLGQQHREPGATEPRDDGAACVADAARNGRNSWSRPQAPESNALRLGPGDGGDRTINVVDTDGARLAHRTHDLRRKPAGASGASQRDDWWTVEPDMGRVAYGVPARMDRLRGIGNAVVPQVAELVGRALSYRP